MNESWMRLVGTVSLCALFLGSGCMLPPPEPRELSQGHISIETPPGEGVAPSIPPPVTRQAYVPVPEPAPPTETYTVVVNEVPVKELLFALARDAGLNIDVHPEITGQVTLNAVDQTLQQILDRISRQVTLRYESRNGTLFLSPDLPFLRAYRIDYVNLLRDTSTDVTTSTQVATTGGGGGGGGNASNTQVTNVSNNRVWETLVGALREIVKADDGTELAGSLESVISNPESGIIMVRATTAKHEMVQAYLDKVMASLHRQVLIEATIVEVELSDGFQSGIDWSKLARNSGIAISNTVNTAFAVATSGVSGLLIDIADQRGTLDNDIQLTVRLLKEFGQTRVLSSPKLMALNNQTAVLKVVDNEVYFTVESDEETDQDTNVKTVTVSSTVNVVPVGLVMNVTPQVSEADVVTLNVRPTITRIREFVNDPGVAIIAGLAGVATAPVNRVPVVQVRETETVMRVSSSQIAVLGGLMQDRRTQVDDGAPGLSDLEQVGGLFEFRDRDSVKTELVIFLRAVVIRSADVEGDLGSFKPFLPSQLEHGKALPTPFDSF